MMCDEPDRLDSLRRRWTSAEGALLLERLRRERLDLDELERAMAAVKLPFLPADLRGVDFSRSDLSHHFLLNDVDLSFARFEQAILRGSFQGATLIEACFDGADIILGYFCQADLRSASFRDARVREAQFEGANLAGVSFQGAVLEDVGFYGVDLTSVDLSGVTLGRVKWAHAQLRRSKETIDLVARARENLYLDQLIWA